MPAIGSEDNREGSVVDEPAGRRVRLVRMSDLKDDVPVWAWSYDGKGRIPLGALALFAGRPGAGKSTGGRWIAASATTGTLAGHWEGKPVNIAYIAAEESSKYVVKPGLRAAGADMDRVLIPTVDIGGEEVRFLSSHDMADLTDLMLEHEVKLVVVDPLMSTIGSKTDINRNNEVRSLVEPWAKLAETIDGVVLGIAHLNKSGNGDVVAGINGSSAFGEVARSVFGFAKDPNSDEGDRIMSQEKNSIGEEDLALTYRIESKEVVTDSGMTAEVGRFVIIGNSDRSVGDVLRDASRPTGEGNSSTEGIDAWLAAMLVNGPVLATEIYTAADQAGFTKDKAKRAKVRLDVRAFRPENPGPWWWEKAGGTEQSEVTTPVSVLPAPCEVRGGAEGGREQSAEPTREMLPGAAAQSGQDDRYTCELGPTGPTGDDQHKQVGPTGEKTQSGQGTVVGPTGANQCQKCGEPLGRSGKCVACIVADASGVPA